MKQKLNLDTWNRKEHFLFFKQMEEPFFGITTNIDCTKAYEKAKELTEKWFSRNPEVRKPGEAYEKLYNL